MTRTTSITVFSRRRLVADVIGDLLRGEPNVATCTSTANPAEFEAAVRRARPSTVVIDLEGTGSDPAGLAEILEACPPARRVGVYDVFTPAAAQVAFELGLSVLLPLTATLEHLVESVLADGRPSSATSAVGLSRAELARLNSLTPRELEVLGHIARGQPVKAVAGMLGIKEHTVETHKRRCFAKLGVQRQSHAVALAAGAGMISLD